MKKKTEDEVFTLFARSLDLMYSDREIESFGFNNGEMLVRPKTQFSEVIIRTIKLWGWEYDNIIDSWRFTHL